MPNKDELLTMAQELGLDVSDEMTKAEIEEAIADAEVDGDTDDGADLVDGGGAGDDAEDDEAAEEAPARPVPGRSDKSDDEARADLAASFQAPDVNDATPVQMRPENQVGDHKDVLRTQSGMPDVELKDGKATGKEAKPAGRTRPIPGREDPEEVEAERKRLVEADEARQKARAGQAAQSQ